MKVCLLSPGAVADAPTHDVMLRIARALSGPPRDVSMLLATDEKFPSSLGAPDIPTNVVPVPPPEAFHGCAAVRRSLGDIDEPLTVAVMGCPVNGPGEAKAADVGLAGGRGKAVLFSRGKILKTVPESRMIAALTEAVREEAARRVRARGER